MAPLALGISIGSTTLSAAIVERTVDGVRIRERRAQAHDGDALGLLQAWWTSWRQEHRSLALAATGRAAVKRLSWTRIDETRALENALPHLGVPTAGRTVVSAGGEMILAYRLDAEGRISTVQSGNKCASGTGAFFRQQVRRMGLGLEEATQLARSGQPVALSRRCSVFCKSDCTHALNKGRSKADVVAGLCEVIAGKIRELGSCQSEGLLLIGGCGRNQAVVERLGGNVVVPEWPDAVEALGAALHALEHCPQEVLAETLTVAPAPDFPRLPPLAQAASLVTFHEAPTADPRPGQDCVVGLDVGSTTTKAVLLERASGEVWGRIYLRTDGDPVAAAQACYRSLAAAAPAGTRVVGLGATGSGRVVAGLHAGATAVVNEILSHARAAARFDAEVDTIFEIGGQDAKYTHLVGGVPADSAMNEACSAGTGSFLEEAAREAFGLAADAIADRALSSLRPTRFNEQCAAFIGSDIATAIDQGVEEADVLAGLVYGVCRNYLNKVKGSRPVGRKVLVQGGVCYNRAVPLAMAALAGRPLVVPPDPGLMGAIGVGLEVRDRLASGAVAEGLFDLHELAQRPFRSLGSSVCKGGREGCDYKCPLLTVEVGGQKQVVGGLCGRWERGAGRRDPAQAAALDGVTARSRLIFADHRDEVEAGDVRPTIGLNRSFLTHSFFPYFQGFFNALGWRVVLSSQVRPEGLARQAAAFCHPFAQAHGLFADLIARNPDLFFLPHLAQLPFGSSSTSRRSCVFVQGEPYALRSAFPEIASERILAPVLDLQRGFDAALPELEALAPRLGADAGAVRRAHRAGVAAYDDSRRHLARLGRDLREAARASAGGFGVVVFGRSYNALSDLGNLGIPRKLAAWGIPAIPFDTLPHDEHDDPQMYWANGQTNLRAARTVAADPDLFGLFITSFSCGPDSFLVTRWRDALAGKPTLTIEIDSHTADAGVDTRLEAFLDVVRAHRRSGRKVPQIPHPVPPSPLACGMVRLADGSTVELRDPRVRVWLPRMGDLGADSLSAVLRAAGLAARPLPPPDAETLQTGRAHSSCKECLPFHLTLGAFIRHLEDPARDKNGIDVFFMPTGDGPCRQGQYATMLERHLRRHQHCQAGVFSPTDENAYAGLGQGPRIDAWRGLCVADLMEDIQHQLTVLAVDRTAALALWASEWRDLVSAMEKPGGGALLRRLRQTAKRLAGIPLTGRPDEAPTIALVGEIFVRKDVFSRAAVVDRLAERGFVVRVAPIREILHYAAWMQCHHPAPSIGLGSRLGARLARFVQGHVEDRVESILARSGLLPHREKPIRHTIALGRRHVDPRLPGETVLTVGSALDALERHSCGVIALGPFGCMPNRLSEALLVQATARNQDGPLPFLALETDGGALPALMQTRLDAFLLQAERRHRLRLAERQATRTDAVPAGA